MARIAATDTHDHDAYRTAPGGEPPGMVDGLRRARDAVRRAFREFLAVPTTVITLFLVLALAVDAVDRSTPGWLAPTRGFLERHVFVDAATTSDVLSAIAGGIITVTSITVSVLLLAVQQSAASMSTAVFDQFLRRRENQLSFGYFIGLGLYTLITLATVHERANAVFGASLGVLLTVVALYVLLVLLYSTVDQMRPSVVLGSISRLTLRARRTQGELVARTRRRATPGLPVREHVAAASSGYVTHVDLPTLERALARRDAAGVELVLLVSVGSFVAHGDALAELRAPRSAPLDGGDAARGPGAEAESLGAQVRRALRLEADRDIAGDPAYGIEQIETIGWTSISSAKSNPAPGLVAIRTLRDLLARWVAERARAGRAGPLDAGEAATGGRGDHAALPVVYVDDTAARAFAALESLGVAASESHQHQSLAEVVRALAALVGRLPADERREAAGVIERLLPSVAGHACTRVLHEALAEAAERFDAAGERGVARAIRDAAARARAGADDAARTRGRHAAS